MNHQLVFLPGLDGTGLLFEPLLKQLPNPSHTIVRYSNLAFDVKRCAKEVLQQVPAEKPLVIIAESYSGAVVPLLRELQPRIKAIIFVATFLTSPHPILSQLSKVAPMGLALKLAYVDWLVKLFCLGNDAGSSVIELFRQALKSADNDAMIQRIHSLAALDMRNKAGWIQGIPCLYIQASQDKLVPSRGYTDFKQVIPELKITRINGPHFLLQARPDKCAKVLSEFLNDQHIKC